MGLRDTYYIADDLKKPIASPRAMMVVEVFQVKQPLETRINALLQGAHRAEAVVPHSSMGVISSHCII